MNHFPKCILFFKEPKETKHTIVKWNLEIFSRLLIRKQMKTIEEQSLHNNNDNGLDDMCYDVFVELPIILCEH